MFHEREGGSCLTKVRTPLSGSVGAARSPWMMLLHEANIGRYGRPGNNRPAGPIEKKPA